jgi:hypothetical protein
VAHWRSAERLKPLSLFDSTSPTIDRALQGVIEWLTTHASASGDDETAAAASSEAFHLVVKLVAARGTLQALLSLACFLSERPALLRMSAAQVLQQLFDLSNFEAAAQASFGPAPGSAEQLLAVWESNVFESVAAHVGDQTDVILDKLSELLAHGDSETARNMLRAELSEEAFASLKMPRLQELHDSPGGREYSRASAALETLRAQIIDGQVPTKYAVLSLFLGHIDLLSQTMGKHRFVSKDGVRAPICVEATARGVQALVTLLANLGAETAVLISEAEQELRSTTTLVLRLLRSNIEEMINNRTVLPADCAAQLHNLVSQVLSVDVSQYKHCRTVCEAGAELYAAGQKFFLRTPEAKLSTARDLMNKLMKQTSGSDAATVSSDEPEPEMELEMESSAARAQNGDLRPLEFTKASKTIAIQGLGLIHGKDAAEGQDIMEGSLECGVAAGHTMAKGRHDPPRYAIEVTLAPDSDPPSKDNPQGFGSMQLAVVRPDCNVHSRMDAWSYDPLSGEAKVITVGDADADEDDEESGGTTHQVSWIEADWWRSCGSAMDGDHIGLLLDCDSGELIAFKNGVELGVVFEGLQGEFCWAISVGPGVRVNVHSAVGVEAVATLSRTVQDANDSAAAAGGRTILDKVAASVLAEVSKPGNLYTFISNQRSNDSLDVAALSTDALNLVSHIVQGWSDSPNFCIPEPEAPLVVSTRQSEKPNAWRWDPEKSDNTFAISADGMTASRSSRRHDYSCCIGSVQMSAGIHEWTLRIERDVDGTWVGVASPNLPTGRDQSLNTIGESEAKVWWWRSAGYVWQNSGGTPEARGQRHQAESFRRGQVIKLRLDCDKGTLEFFQSPGESEPVHTLYGVSGPVVPFVYFDYDSEAVLVSATSKFSQSSTGAPKSVSVNMLCTLVSRSMHLAHGSITATDGQTSNGCEDTAVTMVSQVLAFVRRSTRLIQTTVEESQQFSEFRRAVQTAPLTVEDDTGVSQFLSDELIGWPYYVAENSCLQQLLNNALALATVLLPRRTDDGESVAAQLLPEITSTISSLQEAFDYVPQIMMDPTVKARQNARKFAFEQKCCLSTAEFYVASFGGTHSANMKRVELEYNKAERRPAPRGFRPPCDDHWLGCMADLLAAIGGQCVANLCAGLKDEEAFDVTLFASPRVEAQVGLVKAMCENPNFASIRQRWIGMPAPVLKEVENVAILAMLCHAGVFDAPDRSSVEVQAALLHAGKEAIKIKNLAQDSRRKQQSASATAGDPPTWESVAEPYLQRASLLLQYGGTAEDDVLLPALNPTTGVLEWERDNAATDYRCLAIDKARRFIVDGPPVVLVREVLEARRQSVADAECGYSGALSLLEAGVVHSTGITRSPTLSNRRASTFVSGSWKLTPGTPAQTDAALSVADLPVASKVQILSPSSQWRECDVLEHGLAQPSIKIHYCGFDAEHDEWLDLKIDSARIKCYDCQEPWEYELVARDGFLSGVSSDGKLSLMGRVVETNSATEVSWTALEGDIAHSCFSGTADIVDMKSVLTGTMRSVQYAGKVRKVDGSLQKEGNLTLKLSARNEGELVEGSTELHPSLRGLSLTRRRGIVLQVASAAFGLLGPLSEQQVRLSSDQLSCRVLELLVSDPSTDIQYWACRMLLTRLDDAGTVCLAKRLDQMQVVVRRVLHAKESELLFEGTSSQDAENNSLLLQSTLVAALLAKLATASSMDKSLIVEFIGMVHNEVETGEPSTPPLAMILRGLCHSCHCQTVRTALHSWKDFFWRCVEMPEVQGDPESAIPKALKAAIRNTCLELLSWTLSATAEHLHNLLTLVTSNSIENVLWEGSDTTSKRAEPMPEDSASNFRKNIVLIIRNLIRDSPEWAELFVQAFESAVSQTVIANNPKASDEPNVWPHLLVIGGLQQIVGIGQPESFKRAPLKSLVALVSRVLRHPLRIDCTVAFRTLRARLLKVVWESTASVSGMGLGVFEECLPAIVELGRQPTSVPISTSIETLLAKVKTLHGCRYTAFSDEDLAMLAAPASEEADELVCSDSDGRDSSPTPEISTSMIEGVAAHLGPLRHKADTVAKALAEMGLDESEWAEELKELRSSLEEGWAEHKDTSSGERYYFKSTTGESTWEPPFEPLSVSLLSKFLITLKAKAKPALSEPVQPPKESLLRKQSRTGQPTSNAEDSTGGYKSSGPIGAAIANAEDAIAVYYARLIVRQNLGEASRLCPESFIRVVRFLFKPEAARPTLRPLLLSSDAPCVSINQIDAVIQQWLGRSNHASVVLAEVLESLKEKTPIVKVTGIKPPSKMKMTYPSFEADTVDVAGPGESVVSDGTWRMSGGHSSEYSLCVCKVPFPPTGTHTIKVTVESMGDCAGIGVVTSFANVTSQSNGSKAWIGNGAHGWCLFNDGDCCHSGSWNSGSQRFSAGDTVSITIDSDSGNMTVSSRGNTRSNVYRNLPKPLYLACSTQQRAAFTIDASDCGAPEGAQGVANASSSEESPPALLSELDVCNGRQGSKYWRSFSLWLLSHCMQSNGASLEVSESAVRQLCYLWSGLPSNDRPTILTALARMPAEAVSSGLSSHEDRNQIEFLLEAAYMQHAHEAKTISRTLVFSSYMADLFDVCSKAQASKLLPATGTVRRASPSWTTVWSPTLKGRSITLVSDLVAKQTNDASAVFSRDLLPDTGQHYFEVKMGRPGRDRGRGMGGCYFVGVVKDGADHSAGSIYSKRGSWGLEDNPQRGRREDGQDGPDSGAVPREQCNSQGRVYGNDDTVGCLVNMDTTPRTIQFYRDGTRLEGVTVSGFPAAVRIGCTPFNTNVTATLSFPGHPDCESVAHPTVEVTFTEPGRMGISWSSVNGSTVINSIQPGYQADREPLCVKGLRLIKLDGEDVTGEEFDGLMVKLRAVGRPCTLEFLPVVTAATPPSGRRITVIRVKNARWTDANGEYTKSEPTTQDKKPTYHMSGSQGPAMTGDGQGWRVEWRASESQWWIWKGGGSRYYAPLNPDNESFPPHEGWEQHNASPSPDLCVEYPDAPLPPRHQPGRFTTTWSSTLKHDAIQLESPTLAKNTSGSGECVWASDELPKTGVHYWEVTITRPNKSKGQSMGNCYFVGVLNHSNTSDTSIRGHVGAWGISDDGDSDGIRVNGSSSGVVRPQNANGKAFGSGERVGVLADMDARPRTLQYFREGVRLQEVVVSGFDEQVRLVAVAYNTGATAALVFPASPEGLTAEELSRLAPPQRSDGHPSRATPAGTKMIFKKVSSYDYNESCVEGEVELLQIKDPPSTPPVQCKWPSGFTYFVNYEDLTVCSVARDPVDPDADMESAPEPELQPETRSEAFEPEPEPEFARAEGFDPSIVAAMEGMGFATNACIRAAMETGNSSIQAAVEWFLVNSGVSGVENPVKALALTSSSLTAAAPDMPIISSLWPLTETSDRKAFRKALCQYMNCSDLLQDAMPGPAWWDENKPGWREEAVVSKVVLDQIRGRPRPHMVGPTNSVAFESFETIGAPQAAITAGKVYYEIVVRHVGGNPQFGWCSAAFDTTISEYCGDGVGDDASSWGVDGARRRRWHSGDQAWGEQWNDGDTVGCAADLDTGQLWFSRNGSWEAPHGVAFDGVRPDGGLYPAITASSPTIAVCNFGENPWKFAPPDESYLSVSAALAAGADEDEAGTDFEAGFAESWTLEMDAALIAYATERAAVKGKRSVEELRLNDLLDPREEEEAENAVPTADHEALTRGVSVAPRFTERDVAATPRERTQPKSLYDNRQSSIRARFVILKAWNALICPALSLIDLRQYDDEHHIAHRLCRCKGRLLPSTKTHVIQEALRLTGGGDSVPQLRWVVPMPGSPEELATDSVFEQMFKQLKKSDLTSSRRDGSEAQLWKVAMEGPGANLMHTDTTDAGGWFRACIRAMCTDLQQPPRTIEGVVTIPLLITTPNSVFGGGTGESGMEKWVPNPKATSNSHLEQFHFLGKLMGASARFSGFVEIDMPSLVFKYILRERPGIHEIADIDARTAESLEAVAAVKTEEDFAMLEYTDLLPTWSVRLANGRLVALRGHNATDQVEFSDRGTFTELAEARWVDQFKPALDAVRNGFFSSFPELSTRLLTWRELERRVCGMPDVSVEALKKIARYEGGYSERDAYMAQLWDVLRSFSGQERKQFLGFCWGRGRLPANPTQPFTIDCSGRGDHSLPNSHTCMFQLHLPRYSTPEVLRKNLMIAIQAGGAKSATPTARAVGDEEVEDDTPVTAAHVLDVPFDGGHLETLADFARRAGLGDNVQSDLQKGMKVADMAELLAETDPSSRAKHEAFHKCVGRLLRTKRFMAEAVEQASDAAVPVSPATQPDVAIVAQLTNMGFPESGCISAAIACRNKSVEACVEWIEAHRDDPDFDNTISASVHEGVPPAREDDALTPEAESVLEPEPEPELTSAHSVDVLALPDIALHIVGTEEAGHSSPVEAPTEAEYLGGPVHPWGPGHARPDSRLTTTITPPTLEPDEGVLGVWGELTAKQPPPPAKSSSSASATTGDDADDAEVEESPMPSKEDSLLPPPAFKLCNASSRTIDGTFVRQSDGTYKKEGRSTLLYHEDRRGQAMWVFRHSDGDGIEAPAETSDFPPLHNWTGYGVNQETGGGYWSCHQGISMGKYLNIDGDEWTPPASKTKRFEKSTKPNASEALHSLIQKRQPVEPMSEKLQGPDGDSVDVTPCVRFSEGPMPHAYNGSLALARPFRVDKDLENAADLKGKLVLCERGGNTFAEKAARVAAAGGLALLVVNTTDEGFAPGFDEPPPLPVLGVSSTEGKRLSTAKTVVLSITQLLAADATEVLEYMNAHPEHSEAQRNACALVVRLCKANLTKTLLEGRMECLILAAMAKHGGDAKIIGYSCQALNALCTALGNSDPELLAAQLDSISGAIVDAIYRHAKNRQVAIAGLHALRVINSARVSRQIGGHSAHLALANHKKGISSIIQLLKTHVDSELVQHYGFTVLSNLASVRQLRPKLASKIEDLSNAVERTVHEHVGVEAVVTPACDMLTKLASKKGEKSKAGQTIPRVLDTLQIDHVLSELALRAAEQQAMVEQSATEAGIGLKWEEQALQGVGVINAEPEKWEPVSATLQMGGSGSNGNRNQWFDIRSKSTTDVEIVDIAGWTSNDGARVYWRPGTHHGYEHSSDGWTEIGVSPPPVLSERIVIPASGTVGIYLYGTGSSSISNSDAASHGSCGAVFQEDSNIAVLVGKAADGGHFNPDERGESWLRQGRGKRGLKGRVVYSTMKQVTKNNVKWGQHSTNITLTTPSEITSRSGPAVTVLDGLPLTGVTSFTLTFSGSNRSSTAGMVDPSSLQLRQNLYNQTRFAGGGAGSASDYGAPDWHFYFRGPVQCTVNRGEGTLTMEMEGHEPIHITGVPPGYVFAVDLFNGAICTLSNVQLEGDEEELPGGVVGPSSMRGIDMSHLAQAVTTLVDTLKVDQAMALLDEALAATISEGQPLEIDLIPDLEPEQEPEPEPALQPATQPQRANERFVEVTDPGERYTTAQQLADMLQVSSEWRNGDEFNRCDRGEIGQVIRGTHFNGRDCIAIRIVGDPRRIILIGEGGVITCAAPATLAATCPQLEPTPAELTMLAREQALAAKVKTDAARATQTARTVMELQSLRGRVAITLGKEEDAIEAFSRAYEISSTLECQTNQVAIDLAMLEVLSHGTAPAKPEASATSSGEPLDGSHLTLVPADACVPQRMDVMQKIDAMFVAADKDGDGFLNRREMEWFRVTVGLEAFDGDDMWQITCVSLDADPSSGLTRDQFVRMYETGGGLPEAGVDFEKVCTATPPSGSPQPALSPVDRADTPPRAHTPTRGASTPGGASACSIEDLTQFSGTYHPAEFWQEKLREHGISAEEAKQVGNINISHYRQVAKYVEAKLKSPDGSVPEAWAAKTADDWEAVRCGERAVYVSVRRKKRTCNAPCVDVKGEEAMFEGPEFDSLFELAQKMDAGKLNRPVSCLPLATCVHFQCV